MLPPGTNKTYELTDLLDPSHCSLTVSNDRTESWEQHTLDGSFWLSVKPFIFRHGSTQSPLLLRDEAENHYLVKGVRVFGLVMFIITALLCISSAIWVIVNRKHPVLRAAQPAFLLPICLGCLLEAFCIILLSFDESSVSSEEVLNRLCVATPWFMIVGNSVVYSSLFLKVRSIFVHALCCIAFCQTNIIFLKF